MMAKLQEKDGYKPTRGFKDYQYGSKITQICIQIMNNSNGW